MKKTYEKPEILRRNSLSAVTNGPISGGKIKKSID